MSPRRSKRSECRISSAVRLRRGSDPRCDPRSSIVQRDPPHDDVQGRRLHSERRSCVARRDGAQCTPCRTGDPRRELVVASPEDVIAQKLYWFALGDRVSERQWSDALGVLNIAGDRLDLRYLDQVAEWLSVRDLFEESLRQAGVQRGELRDLPIPLPRHHAGAPLKPTDGPRRMPPQRSTRNAARADLAPKLLEQTKSPPQRRCASQRRSFTFGRRCGLAWAPGARRTTRDRRQRIWHPMQHRSARKRRLPSPAGRLL